MVLETDVKQVFLLACKTRRKFQQTQNVTPSFVLLGAFFHELVCFCTKRHEIECQTSRSEPVEFFICLEDYSLLRHACACLATLVSHTTDTLTSLIATCASGHLNELTREDNLFPQNLRSEALLLANNSATTHRHMILLLSH
jgi:hypothetical protein